MESLLLSIVTQTLTFLPLALGISISFRLLKATDMTLDGSFVLGAAVFARLVTAGISPTYAAILALLAGSCTGMMVSLIQHGGKVDSLLAGVLATFILISGNLALMGRPNINLLSVHTLLSSAFDKSDLAGWTLVAIYSLALCAICGLMLRTRFGLMLRALGDNPHLLQRLGSSVEGYRLAGFALTNTLAAASGMLTAQTIGYADISMGFGMTLTGIGAIILGQQMLKTFYKADNVRIVGEFIACLLGVVIYFFAINTFLRFDINPVYLKMVLGVTLIFFLRMAVTNRSQGSTT